MKKFFYFRSATAIGDDDLWNDSILLPVNMITGLQALTGNTVEIYFESRWNDEGVSAFGDEYFLNSTIVLAISSSGYRRKVMEAIAVASNSGPHNDGIIVIADDVTKEYISPYITSISSVNLYSQLGADS